MFNQKDAKNFTDQNANKNFQKQPGKPQQLNQTILAGTQGSGTKPQQPSQKPNQKPGKSHW